MDSKSIQRVEVNTRKGMARNCFAQQERTTALNCRNEQLKDEAVMQTAALVQSKRSRADLERLIAERTTELRRAVEEKKVLHQKLMSSERELREIDTALKVLLKRRDIELGEIREEIAAKAMQTVVPLIKKAQKGASGRTREYIATAHVNLLEVFSPDSSSGPLASAGLSPRELQITNYVRQGRTSKEMADLLDLSVRTIEYYRENIRRKLGIKGEKKNLRKLVLSLP